MTKNENRSLMTERIFLNMINRLPAGEYNFSDLYGREYYNLMCPKTYQDMHKWENSVRKNLFFSFLSDKKWGLEYLTHGKMHYIGTADLNTLVVKW